MSPRPKKYEWKDMCLAPTETHVLLFDEARGIYIGIYRIHEQWDNWYAIEHTSRKPGTGCYRPCNPIRWAELPKYPDLTKRGV